MLQKSRKDEHVSNHLRAMRPLSKLIRRVNRLLVLLMMRAHGRWMVVQGVRRHAFIDVFVVVWDFDFARELDVIVLLSY
jgi:hypothetical protein